MATYSTNGASSRKGLKIGLFLLIAMFGAIALVLGLCLNKRVELSVTPELNAKVEVYDSASLLSSNGWNDDIAIRLHTALSGEGDNVALGNAGGVIATKVLSLGGYSWSVVYKQKGIVTLYANEPVAYMAFDNATNSYSDSTVREYLNGEFYNEFMAKVGFSGFEDLIVPFGVNELYYQMDGAQAIPLKTIYGEEISNCDGIKNDKFWLPSAYEVGGFEVNKTSPKARVNSFKTIKEDGFSINTGLWNLSNNARLMVDNALLRANAGNGVAYIDNGLVLQGKNSNIYAIRPCFNMVLPEVNNGVVVDAEDTGYHKNDSLLASVVPDYSAQLRLYTTETSGVVFTPKSGNVTVDGVSMTYSQALLLELSDAVNAGQDMSGKTFNLIQDVDMSSVTVWNPIGRKNFPFSGVFNGNGYKISNLCGAGSGFVGLFGYVSGSAAKVYQVAVVDSAWYTTNNEVGAIAGIIANSATVEQCYSDSGISGGDYVGGLVGRSTSTSSITNCYNLSGVAGVNYVGGIIGSNGGTTVTNSYNVGAVSATTSYAGGVVGQNLSAGKYSGKVAYSSENNTTANASITNVTGTAYTTIQGAKTSSGVTKPTALTSWTFDGSPWTISATLNDHLPILKCFVKQVTLNVRSNDTTNMVSINGGTYASEATLSRAITATGAVTVRARANFSGTSHFILNSWNIFEEPFTDVIVSTEDVYASAGTPTTSGNYRIFTLTFTTLDDSYNIEAIFEKLYSFSVSPVFNGFSNTSSYAASELSITTSATAFESVWYRAGDTATITIGTPSGRAWDYTGLTGSTNGGTSWSSVSASTTAGSFIYASNTTAGPFTVTIGHSTAYVSSDAYVLRPNFDRYYNITIANSLPSITSPPTVVTSITLSNPSATVKSSDTTKTAKLKYNGTITTAVVTADSGYTDYFSFTSWELLDNTVALGTWTNKANSSISVSTQANSVISLTMRANFGLANKTVSITEMVGSTATSNAGIYTLSTNSGLTSVSADSGALTVPYGTSVYLYVLPAFASGYAYKSFSQGATPTAVGTAGLLKFNFTVTATATYTVTYELAARFNIAFSAYLDNAASTGVFTFNPTSYSNITFTTNIGAAKVTNAADKYVLSTIKVSYGNKTDVAIETNSRPSGGYVAETTNNIFDGVGTTKTVQTLLSKIGATATYNTYDITVKVYFISIIRTITVTEQWYGVNHNGAQTTLTHSAAYSIKDTTLNKAVTGQGVYQNSHTLTASPTSGYKVTEITTSLTSTKSVPATWGGVATATFTLSDNITITIKYQAHSYKVVVSDNLVSLGTTSNSYTYKIGSTSVTPSTANTVYVNVGNTITVAGYSTLKTVDSKSKAKLESITVKNGTTTLQTITDIDSQWTRTFSEGDTNDNISLTFNYILLRSVQITLQDAGASTDANKALVVLKSSDSNYPNIVLLVNKDDSSVYADCVNGVTYEVSAIIPVYVSSASGSTSSITVSSNSSVIIQLQQDLQNASVFASEIF